MKFKEGESFKVGVSLTIPDGDALVALAVEFRGPNGISLKRFSTKNASIVLVSGLNYSFSFTDQSTLGKSGEGTYEVEIETEFLGVKKSTEYKFEIVKATARRATTETPVTQSGYGAVINVAFQAGSPIVQSFVGNFIRLTAALEAEAARDLAQQYAEATAEDATATAADRVATGQDRVATGEDRVATNADAETTAADRIATGEDAIATAADRIATREDRVATAADRVATGEDAVATAADRVAVGEARDLTIEAKNTAVAAAGNILTLVSYTDTTVSLGIGGSVTIEEGPSVYPSLNITFL